MGAGVRNVLYSALVWAQPVDMTGPELPRALQDLILRVLGNAVWEGSSHSGLFAVSLSSPAQLRALLTPLEAGLRAQLLPLREGLLSQQSNYPKCQQENCILGPQPVHFVLFSSLPHSQKLLSPSKARTALGGLQQSHAQRAVSPVLCIACPALASANLWEMSCGCGDLEKLLGPEAGPHRYRGTDCAGLSWLRGCLAHLRPAGWHHGCCNERMLFSAHMMVEQRPLPRWRGTRSALPSVGNGRGSSW